MRIEQIRKARDARPFQRFTIVVADGNRYRVAHPENLFIPRRAERHIAFAEGDDDFGIINLFMVTALEFKADKTHRGGTAPNENAGRPRRR